MSFLVVKYSKILETVNRLSYQLTEGAVNEMITQHKSSMKRHMKYGNSPSPMIKDELVLLKLKLAAILLSGNIVLNKSPIWSNNHKL